MRFTTILASAAALAAGASAKSSHPFVRSDIHIGDFRIFGQHGCSLENWGIWTVLQDGLNRCTPLRDITRSVYVQDLNANCTLTLYTDEGCTIGATQAQKETCNEAEDEWNGFFMKC